jgi:hypothetical protein
MKDGRRIIIGALVAGAVICVCAFAVSFAVIGPSIYFAGGLVAGLIAGLAAVLIMYAFIKLTADTGNRFLTYSGLFIRLILLAGVFAPALIFFGTSAGIGCAVGYCAVYFGVPVSVGIINKKKKGSEGSTYGK